MNAFGVVAGLCSVLGFMLGLLSSQWGRAVMTDMARSIKVPFLGSRLVRLGIYDVFDSRKSLSQRQNETKVFDYFKLAETEIGIIATSLNYSVVHQHIHLDLQKVLRSNPKMHVFIFLLDPECAAVDVVARASGRTPHDLREYILQSIERLRAMISELGEDEDSRIQVALCDTILQIQCLFSIRTARRAGFWLSTTCTGCRSMDAIHSRFAGLDRPCMISCWLRTLRLRRISCGRRLASFESIRHAFAPRALLGNEKQFEGPLRLSGTMPAFLCVHSDRCFSRDPRTTARHERACQTWTGMPAMSLPHSWPAGPNLDCSRGPCLIGRRAAKKPF